MADEINGGSSDLYRRRRVSQGRRGGEGKVEFCGGVEKEGRG